MCIFTTLADFNHLASLPKGLSIISFLHFTEADIKVFLSSTLILKPLKKTYFILPLIWKLINVFLFSGTLHKHAGKEPEGRKTGGAGPEVDANY